MFLLKKNSKKKKTATFSFFFLLFPFLFLLLSYSPRPPPGPPSPRLLAISDILTFIPSTDFACASFIASVTRAESLSAPWECASSVMSTERGSWEPLMTTRTVSSEEKPSNSAR